MDPSSVAEPIIENDFGFASNRHLYEWLVENDVHNEQIQTHYRDVDKQYTNKQNNVNGRIVEMGEIYDSIERTFAKRNETDAIEMAGWREDYLSNETDPQLILPQSDAVLSEPQVETMIET